MTHEFDPTILRAYDIRGEVGKNLTEADATALGQAFGTRVARTGGESVCVGWDGRLHSLPLAEALQAGLLSTGIHVHVVGMGPTPMLYYAVHELETAGGIMVTGSHNPATYNGFKMVLHGAPFFGDDIQKLARIVAEGDVLSGAGRKHMADDLFDRYVRRLRRDFDGARPLNVVWDAGNGAVGPALRALTDGLPGVHTLLFDTVDGHFPNHHPDPTEPENLEDLIRAVRRKKADVGVAFDGDGDRLGVVDGKGRILWGDQIMILLAEEVLADCPGAPIIADVKASQTLFDEIRRFGGRPVMEKTGHSIIKKRMAELSSPLAGEMSGHIFFAHRYYGFDDALYAAVRFLGILSRMEVDLATRRDALPSAVNTPELRFSCPETRKFTVIEEVKTRLSGEEGVDVDDTDGVRVTTPAGWWLLRASNTQPVLVGRCEGRDEAALEKLKASLREQLEASDITTDF